MRFLIISGMSGAGKSRAMAALEDIGFYCVDNMPLALISVFAELCIATVEKYENVALVADARAGTDFNSMFDSLDNLQGGNFKYEVLFLDASTDILINRYKETRRKHPLETGGVGLTDAMLREREIMESIKNRADYIIDTSTFSVKRLRENLINLFSGRDINQTIAVSILSFGFKYGVPVESDLIFDVRFLPNPYYDINLRPRTGIEKEVRDYVYSTGKADEFMKHLLGMLDFLMPLYIEEGKSSLVISIGCTGGRHRSVAIAEDVKNHLAGNGYYTILSHRDYHR